MNRDRTHIVTHMRHLDIHDPHPRTNTHIHTYTRTHAHTHTHTYTYTHTHTHTHTDDMIASKEYLASHPLPSKSQKRGELKCLLSAITIGHCVSTAAVAPPASSDTLVPMAISDRVSLHRAMR